MMDINLNTITVKEINDIICNQLSPIMYYGKSLHKAPSLTPEQHEMANDMLLAGNTLHELAHKLSMIKGESIKVGRSLSGIYDPT